MAWPRCPHCGERDFTEGQRADEVTPAESTVFRSWPCRRCGKILWTAETVFCDDAPTVWLGRKFGADFEENAPPCDDVRPYGARDGRGEPMVVLTPEAATAPPVSFPATGEKRTC